MSQFHSEDFRDSIDSMCDDALERMHAFRQGELDAMQANDHFYSRVIERNVELEVIEYDTQIKTSIIDDIHADVLADRLPDYTLDILGGAMIALARYAAYHGRQYSDILVPTYEATRSHVAEKMLLGSQSIVEKNPIELLSYELGAASVTSLVIGPHNNAWELYYDSHHHVALVRW